MVRLEGIEPPSSVPKTDALSVELQTRVAIGRRFAILLGKIRSGRQIAPLNKNLCSTFGLRTQFLLLKQPLISLQNIAFFRLEINRLEW